MNDTLIFLSAGLIGAGVYIMHLHSVLNKYRKWASQAQTLLIQLSMKAAAEEYGFDLEERDEDA